MCLNHPELVHKDKTLHPNSCDKFDPVINPRRACAARVTVVGFPAVCMFVCLSTLILALQATKAAYERYQRLQNNANLKNKRAILLKRLC